MEQYFSFGHKINSNEQKIVLIMKTIKQINQNINHSLKYLRSTTLCCKDLGIRKLEFVAKTQFL